MEKVWQKRYAKGVPVSVKFEEITLSQALARTATKFPQTNALMFQGTDMTFRELDEAAAKFATGLRSLGVKPGDRVSIILPNLIQTVVGIYGALYAGAIVVMHNPRNDDMTLEHQLNDSGATVAICLDLLVPRVNSLRKRTKLKSIVSCHIRDYLPFVKKQLFAIVKKELHLKTPAGLEGVIEFSDVLEGHKAGTRPHKSAIEDTAFILYTSATTGKSKGVELTHGNLSKNVQQVRSWFPTFEDGKEIVVACLPFFHVFGLTCSLNIGICHGFGNVLVPLPEPRAILDAAQAYKATYIPALPVWYTGMINDPAFGKYDLKSLKACFSGAAPLPLEIIRKFEKLTGAQICEGYGLTECAPVSHINPLGGRCKPGTIGLPLPDTDAKIVDVDDYTREITSPGVPGELCVRGPQVMKGYVNLPEQTQATLMDEWLRTGDIAMVDEEGYFSVVDRKRDMLVSGGQKVYPRRVDEVLFSHPKVLDAASLGVPDPDGGETLKAFVVLKKDQEATAPEILDFCRRKLAAHEVPNSVEFVPDLPRSPAGKVLRKELRRMHLVRSSRTEKK